MSENRGKRIFFFITGIMLSCIIFSQEFAILSDTMEWEYNNPTYAFNWFMPHAYVPENWQEPYDFYNGQIYTLYQVISQPTNDSFALQFGIWQTQPDGSTNELMEDLRQLDGGVGTFAVNHDVPASWWFSNEGVDFSRIKDIEHLGINAWCLEPRSPVSCADWGGNDIVWANRGKWFPLRVYVIVVAVAEGYTFSGWDNYAGKITSVRNKEKKDFRVNIYPNPSNHHITIKTDNISGYSIELLNMNGIKLMTEKNISGRNYTLDISDFPAGCYFIQISSENSFVTGKIIKY